MSNIQEKKFNNALIASIVLHILLSGVFLFGIPSFNETLPDEEDLIAFEMLPIEEVANIKNQTPLQTKIEEVEKAKKVEKTKPPEPEIKPEKKIDKKEEPKKNKEVEPKKTADAVPTKKEPVKPIKPEEEKKSVTPKVEDKKKEKDKPKNEDPMENLLKNLEQASEGDVVNSNKTALKTSLDDGKFAKSDNYNEDLPQSNNEKALIRMQIGRNWNQQRFMGIPRIREVIASLNISLDKNGKVLDVKPDKGRSRCPAGMADICQNVAESVQQAIWNSSPFAKLSPSRYKIWNRMELDFTPEL